MEVRISLFASTEDLNGRLKSSTARISLQVLASGPNTLPDLLASLPATKESHLSHRQFFNSLSIFLLPRWRGVCSKMRWFLSFLLLGFLGVVHALSTSGTRLLVVSEDKAEQDLYSIFWKDLKGVVFRICFDKHECQADYSG